MGCPDENSLVQLVEGTLPTDVRADRARHLDECASCRRAVGSLVRLLSSDENPALARTLASEPPPAPAAPHDVASGSREKTPGGLGFLAGDVVGRYQLERVLGEGGLGVVWAARHILTRKVVALKFTKFDHPELMKRFLREARVGGVLRHRAVVEVHDVFESHAGGPLVMVMDLLHGESLDQLLARRQRISPIEAMFLLQPVLSALVSAHALGIVHRDIKPPNIFLEQGEGGPFGRLLDFGLARLTATEGAAAMTSVLTREKQLMGTPHYMAPEQLYGEIDIDLRTDVWAMGVVFYECLTGRRPLEGGSVGQILRSLATTEIAPIANVAAEVPSELARAIDASLTRDRAARLPSILPLLSIAERALGMPPTV